MSYNLPPPGGDIGPEVGPGFGGGFPGIGFPGAGFGKSFNLDVGGGFGLPGIFGGGIPGWGAPYVPVTPLGGLWGFKGDLIVPMVAIGVAIFLLLLIVLAVKYALAWKLTVLDDLAGGAKRLRREAGTAPAEQLEDNNLNKLADIVSAAIYSEGCSRRILCEIGSYAKNGHQYPSLIRLLELVVPEEYHESFLIVRQSAEGNFNCAEEYPCGGTEWNKKEQTNVVDVTGDVKASKPAASNQTTTTTTPAVTTSSGSTSTTPAPNVFGKFKRAMF